MDKSQELVVSNNSFGYKKFENAVVKIIDGANVLFLTTMIVLVFTNVVLRYGFNSGISVSVELSRFLFVWICFLGAVNALIHNQHLIVTTLVGKLPVFIQHIVYRLSILVMGYCCYLFIDGSYKQAVINWTNISPISQLPNGIFYIAGVISGSLMLIVFLHRLIFGMPPAMEDKE